MKKVFFICCLLAVCFLNQLSAQDTIVYYNLDWKTTAPEEAFFYSYNKSEGDIWHRQNFYVSNQVMQEDGYYKDAASKIKHGEIVHFYPNKNLAEKVYYQNNKKEGVNLAWYSNGMLSDSANYFHGTLRNTCAKWYMSGEPKLEMQLDSLGNGTGIVIGWFKNGNVSFKGKLGKGFRKEGKWVYYHENGNKSAMAIYPKFGDDLLYQNKFLKYDFVESFAYDSTVLPITQTCYDEDGIEQAACPMSDSSAVYLNKPKAWVDYVEARTGGIIRNFKIEGAPIFYTVSFTVNTAGQIEDVLLDYKGSPDLDKQIEDVFKYAKKWKPAINHNRKVPTEHRQRVVIKMI